MVAVIAAAAVLMPVGPRLAAAQSSNTPGDGVVVIANGWSPPDVGAAAPLAGRLNAAVLYAASDELGQPTIDALEELNPSRVLLMGGTAALTSAVESGVRSALPGVTVERFSGDDRIDTAARAALSEPAVPAGRPVVIANGWSPPDVGTAAPLAASLDGSVLFAQRDSLGDATVNALRRLAPSRVILVGGTAALTADIESQLEAAAEGVPIQRLGGANRVDSAALGAFMADVDLGEPVVLADGWNSSDVGIAAPLAAALGGNVLLTERSKLGERTAEALQELSPSHIILIGGSDRLAEAVDAGLEHMYPDVPRVNIAGTDRIVTASLAALFGVQFSTEQQRFEEAVASITPGKADCDAAPRLDIPGIEVVDPPLDLNDPTTPLTVAEVVRIAGGCALVSYVALHGRSVIEVRDLLAGRNDVFAVGEPARGVSLAHSDGAHQDLSLVGAEQVDDHHDANGGEQWHLPQPYMNTLWDGWQDANPVTVAVIDSGIDDSHPDFAGRVANAPGAKLCDREDPDGHGTSVAGIIAAAGHHVTGVAPRASILPIRFKDRRVIAGAEEVVAPRASILPIRFNLALARKYDSFDFCPEVSAGVPVTLAIAGAVNGGANVINMSFKRLYDECEDFSITDGRGDAVEKYKADRGRRFLWLGSHRCTGENSIDAALRIADALGVVVVAASGNCGSNALDSEGEPHYSKQGCSRINQPSSFLALDSVITVASIDIDGDRSQWSNAHEHVDIAAPGEDIRSSAPGSVSPGAGPLDTDVTVSSGTSSAAPFVAGVVAHLLNRYPDASAAQIRKALYDTAHRRVVGNRDDQYGHGKVRPLAAIHRLREILGLNYIEHVTISASNCAPDDDTPSCPDPALIVLQPEEGALDKAPQHFTADLPPDASYITVDPTYRDDGRPGRLAYFLRDESLPVFLPDTLLEDANPAVAGFQFVTGTGSQQLKIYTPDWKGDRSALPSVEITFRGPVPLTDATEIGASTARPIETGTDHSCALDRIGTISCWGFDDSGQKSLTSGTGFTSVAAGARHTCALGQNGAISCWGANDSGQTDAPNGTGYRSVAAGGFHSCALDRVGTISCWGSNDHGQLRSPPGTGYTAVTTGHEYSCALDRQGAIRCWGARKFWRLPTPAGNGFTAIAAGGFHACALDSKGAIACWGATFHGQHRSPPGSGYTAIASGGSHSCALNREGVVVCWGGNGARQAEPPNGIHYQG